MVIHHDTVIVGYKGKAAAIDKRTGASKFILCHDDFESQIMMDCSEELIVTISNNRDVTKNKLIIWDYGNGEKLVTFDPKLEKKQINAINTVKLMKDRILTGGDEGCLMVMKIERDEFGTPNSITIENMIKDEGNKILWIDGQGNTPITITKEKGAWSLTGIKTWDIKKGKCIDRMKIPFMNFGQFGPVTNLPYVVAATNLPGQDGIHIWDIQQGKKVATLCEKRYDYCVNITANDERIAVAEDLRDGTFYIDLWTWRSINGRIQRNNQKRLGCPIMKERRIIISNCHIQRILLTNTCLCLLDRIIFTQAPLAQVGVISLKTIDFWTGKEYIRQSDAYVHRSLGGRLQFLILKRMKGTGIPGQLIRD